MNLCKIFKGREKARRYAMQALYGWILTGNSLIDIENHYLADRNPNKFDVAYFLQLLHGVPSESNQVDSMISPYLSRPLGTLDPIELTILRIAAYEVKNIVEVPTRVIINEALELAKTFGATDSYKFINGVLDCMLKNVDRK